MRAEREAKEVGEERRRDGEGTEVTFTCRWSCSGLVLMMSVPPAVSLQSQSMECNSAAASLQYTKFFSPTVHEVIHTAGRVSTASPH